MSRWYHPTISSSVAPFYYQSFLASGSFPMSWLFTSDGPSIGAFSISPSNEYSKLISFRIEWFDLLAPRDSTGLSRVFSRTRIQKSNNSLAVSLLYDPTLTPIHSYWKAMALFIRTFVVKVTSLLFNTLSRFVIAFLPRSKPVLISWLQSPSIVILEPKKIVCEPWPLSFQIKETTVFLRFPLPKP